MESSGRLTKNDLIGQADRDAAEKLANEGNDRGSADSADHAMRQHRIISRDGRIRKDGE
jgi:hypothetical protein